MNVEAIKRSTRTASRVTRRVCLRCTASATDGVHCATHAAENRHRAAQRYVATRNNAECVDCHEPMHRIEQLTMWGGVDVLAGVRCRECASVHRFKGALAVVAVVQTQGVLL